MDRLRIPFFVVAVVLLVLAVLLEFGTSFFVKSTELEPDKKMVDDLAKKYKLTPEGRGKAITPRGKEVKPPGRGIPMLALLDGLVLFTVGLMGAGLLVPERIQGKLQGIVSLIVALVVLLLAIVSFYLVLMELMLMVTLLMAAPFGTLAYLALYGTFPRGTASVMLSLMMSCKLGFAGCLVLAHQRFLQGKGLVLIVLTSLLATVIVSFLHGLVPSFLVSITDAIAALVAIVLAGFWSIFILVFAVVSVIKAIV